MQKIIMILVLIFFTISLLSDETGSISGVVLDEHGDAVIFAAVFLRGTEFGMLSDEEGYFLFENIPVGEYDVVASFPGYAQYIKSGVVIYPDSTSIVNFTLQRVPIRFECEFIPSNSSAK